MRFKRTRNWALGMAVLVVVTIFFVAAMLAGILANGWPRSVGDYPTLLAWLESPPNPWLIVNAAMSALGATSAFVGFFKSEPASAAEVTEIVGGAEDRLTAAGSAHAQAVLTGQAGTDQKIDDLAAQVIALTTQLALNQPQVAQAAEVAAAELLATGSNSDRAIVASFVGDNPQEAGDALMAEIEAGKQRNAERARQAARLYAPFAPRKAMAAYRQAVDLDPSDTVSWIELARLRAQFEGLAAARGSYQTALQHCPTGWDRALVELEMAELLARQGDAAGARTILTDLIPRFEKAVETFPEELEVQRTLAHVISSLADVAANTGEKDECATLLAREMAIRLHLAQIEPDDFVLQHDLTTAYNKAGALAENAGEYRAAREHYRRASDLRQRFHERAPDDLSLKQSLATSCVNLGRIEKELGDFGAARDLFDKSATLREDLQRSDPEHAGWQADLAASLRHLGDIALVQGASQEARELFERAFAIYTRLAERDPERALWQRNLSATYNRLGDVEMGDNTPELARPFFARSLAVIEGLALARPDQADWQRELSVSLLRLGDCDMAIHDYGAAKAAFTRGNAIRQLAAEDALADLASQRDFAISLDRLANAEVELGDLGAARSHREQALTINLSISNAQPDNFEWLRGVWASHGKLAILALAEDRRELALDHFDNSEDVLEELQRRWPDHPGLRGDHAAIRKLICGPSSQPDTP